MQSKWQSEPNAVNAAALQSFLRSFRALLRCLPGIMFAALVYGFCFSIGRIDYYIAPDFYDPPAPSPQSNSVIEPADSDACSPVELLPWRRLFPPTSDAGNYEADPYIEPTDRYEDYPVTEDPDVR